MKQFFRANRGFLLFMLCLGVFRTAVADYNPIPSGSMRPTLLEGDVVLVNRLAYDVKLPLTDRVLMHLADPQRGDVVTFSSPRDGTRLIKRLVAVPGDVVEVRDGVLLVNGQAAHYDELSTVSEPLGPDRQVPALRATEQLAGSSRHVQYLRGATAARRFGPLTLGRDEFFMLGDNRDNSEDSRYIGPVQRQLLVGRAHRVLVSVDILGHWAPRLERWVSPIQ
jgi:signal peptidase I